MFKEFLTRNIGLKFSALVLAAILWLIARYWMVR